MTYSGFWATRAGQLAPVGLGLMLATAVLLGAKWAVIAVIGVAAVAIGVTYPLSLVALMWMAMLMDRAGVTGVKFSDFPVTASKLSVVASVGLWTLHAVLSRVQVVRWHSVLWGLMALLASTAVCIAVSNSMKAGKFDLYGIGMMAVMVALVFAILAEAPLQPIYRFCAGVFVIALGLSIVGTGGTGEAARVTGTMGDPNEWATLVLLTTPFLLGGLVDEVRAPWRLLRLSLVVLAPISVFASGSRSALAVGVLVALLCLGLLRKHTNDLLVAAGLAALFSPFWLERDAVLFRLELLWDNFRGTAVIYDDSFAERSELFRQGKALFLDHFFLGAGPGNFERATGFVSNSGALRPAHNTYLEIAAEQGLLGLFATAGFGLTVAFTFYRGYRVAGGSQAKHRVLGVAIGLAALALMATTLGLLTFSTGYLVLGIGLAVVHQGTHGLVR